jgi:hypothetical protein
VVGLAAKCWQVNKIETRLRKLILTAKENENEDHAEMKTAVCGYEWRKRLIVQVKGVIRDF